jgi:hypothetical protein
MKMVSASFFPTKISLFATAQTRMPSATKEATKLVASNIPNIGVM